MRLRLAPALCLIAALAAPTLRAQNAPAGNAPPKEAPKPDPAMQAMMDYATPGDAQKKLETWAGTWENKVKMWMAPGAPPQESAGTSEMKMVMGGRYLEQKHEGTFMNMPFSGLGYTGYDNFLKKYISTWVDNMGTGIMVTTGTADKSGKVITSYGTVPDPVKKKTTKVKTVAKLVDNDHMTYEMWEPGEDGKTMVKILEVDYTRKK